MTRHKPLINYNSSSHRGLMTAGISTSFNHRISNLCRLHSRLRWCGRNHPLQLA